MPAPPELVRSRMPRGNIVSNTNEYGLKVPSSNWRNYEPSLNEHRNLYNAATGYMYNSKKEAKQKMRNTWATYRRQRNEKSRNGNVVLKKKNNVVTGSLFGVGVGGKRTRRLRR